MPNPPSSRPRTKAEQRLETTEALRGHARRLFATRGYNHVSLAVIVAAAGVTKGALYHHFPGGKEQLFRAVLEQIHQEVARRIEMNASEGDDPWMQLVAGSRTFLAASTEPGIVQIMLLDAPVVLGWETWRALDAVTSRKHLRDIVVQLIDDGTIVAGPVEPVVHLLSGAMNEASLWVARSNDRDRDLADAAAVLTTMLESLRSQAW